MIQSRVSSVGSDQTRLFLRLLIVVLLAVGMAVLCILVLYRGRAELALILLVGLFGGIVLAFRPVLGLYTVFAATVAVDPYSIFDGPQLSTLVPFWSAFDTFSSIPFRSTPAELVMLATIGLAILCRAHRGQSVLRLGRLFPCVVLLMATVVHGIWRGVTHQDLQLAYPFFLPAAVAEVRPFAYFLLMYLLTHTVVESPGQLRVITWILIATIGFKALQGTSTVVILGSRVFDFNEIAPHRDSLYLSLLIVLTLVLWLYRAPPRQLWVALCLMPCVLMTLVANQRRVGYIALGLGLLIMWVLLLSDTSVRRRVIRGSVVAVLVLTGYLAAFWDSDSPVAQPILAVQSVYGLVPEEASSNQWRQMENLNLAYTIERDPLLGLGFGQRYLNRIFQPSITSSGFTYWRYIPHNSVYWVWVKLGAIGFTALWLLIGSAVLLACLAFRRASNPDLKIVAITAMSFIVMHVIFSYGDLLMASVQSMAYLGAWLGIVASADRFAQAEIAERGRWASAGGPPWTA